MKTFDTILGQRVAGKRRPRDVQTEILDSAESKENVAVQIGSKSGANDKLKSA